MISKFQKWPSEKNFDKKTQILRKSWKIQKQTNYKKKLFIIVNWYTFSLFLYIRNKIRLRICRSIHNLILSIVFFQKKTIFLPKNFFFQKHYVLCGISTLFTVFHSKQKKIKKILHGCFRDGNMKCYLNKLVTCFHNTWIRL